MDKKRILCVDDEEGVLNSVRRILERKGYQFVAALNGEEALNIISSVSVDLIILDVVMPGMDGYELLKEIRLSKQCSAPVVMLTAKNKLYDILKGYGEGAVYYITKPFESTQIIKIVDHFIGDSSENEKEAVFETRL